MIEFDRIWAMPNHLTFKIKPISDLLKSEVISGKWIDPFSNDSYIKKISHAELITNDINPACNSDHHLDAVEFLKLFEDLSLDGVLYDPPYSLRQVSECYKGFGYEVTQETTRADWWTKNKAEIARIVKPGGKVISFGWNSGDV